MADLVATALVVFVSFWLLWHKLPLVTRLRLLYKPFALDLAITVGVFLLYGGTGTGLMAATGAALTASISISMARKTFGYMEWKRYRYYPGRINLADKIQHELRMKHGNKTNEDVVL